MTGRTIALLTDFGTADHYVGVMKGVMLGIFANCQFVDITHQIAPQSVRDAAFDLLNAVEYFPANTIFLIVVDPGVGSSRRPVAVQYRGYLFVAPDNGVLSYVIAEPGDAHIVQLDNPQYHLPHTSNTFHGRDIFAPAAAHLANGIPLHAMGTIIADLITLPKPRLSINPQQTQITGEVIRIDHFGNIVTSIGKFQWAESDQLRLTPRFGQQPAQNLSWPAAQLKVRIAQQIIAGIQRAYSDTTPGTLIALIGSSGHLEIAVNQGHAAAHLNVTIGDQIDIEIG